MKFTVLCLAFVVVAYGEHNLIARDDSRSIGSPSGSELSLRRLRNSVNGHTKFRDLFNEMFSGLWENNLPNFPEMTTGTNDLMSQFFRGYKPWWKGDHVCVSEEETEEDPDDSILGAFMSSSTQCYSTDSVHKCIIKVGGDGKVKVTTITHQCCHGYTRDLSTTNGGCSKEADLTSLKDTINEMNLTAFASTLKKLNLENTIASGNFTVFTPTNEAMTTENPEMTTIVTDTNNEDAFLKQIIQNHMIEGWKFGHDFKDEEVVLTQSDGKPLRTNFYRHPVPFATVNCAKIVSPDNKATNGIVHVIDRVLMPVDSSSWDYLKMDSSLSEFFSLIPSEMEEKFKDAKSHITVFAFSNSAFEKLPSDVKSAIKDKKDCFKDLIKHHLLDFTLCSSAIQGTLSTKSLAGNRVNLTRAGTPDVAYVDGGALTKSDRMTTNGVIHVIDKVLLDETMMNALSVIAKDRGEAFVDLAESSGLANQIKEMPEVTIFVPPGDQLIEATESLTPEQTKTLLKAHISESLSEVSFRSPRQTVKDLNDVERNLVSQPQLLFTGPGLGAKSSIQCSRLIRANVQTCGGVVHYIDKPLQSPSKNMYETIKANANYSQFLLLIEAAEMEDELKKDDFEQTVLIPSDSAFEGKKELLDGLLANEDKLKKFIKGHFLRDEFCCNEMGGTHWFRNVYHTGVHGFHVSGYNQGTTKRIGGTAVTKCDIIATNGIAHVISSPMNVPLDSETQRSSRLRWWE